MHYVTSDLHGNGPLWGKIKEKLNNDDVLYFLGDAADRGPDGLLIMTDMLNDIRVIYIKGNHEVFAEEFLKHAIHTDLFSDIPKSALDLWECNGGSKTMHDIWLDMSKEDVEKLYFKLKSLPQRVDVTVGDTRFLLSHAGYTPRYLARDLEDDKDILLWSREHFSEAWNNAIDGENTIVLHGHTPVGFLKSFEYADGDKFAFFDKKAFVTDEDTKKFEPLVYAGGHKIDLDLCSVASNRAALYCLETKTWEIIDINND